MRSLRTLRSLENIYTDHTQGTPPEPSPAAPYLDQLEQLASPVPNLAATLMTQAEQSAEDENIDFLRQHEDDEQENQPVPMRQRSTYVGRASFYDDGSAVIRRDNDTRRRMHRAIEAMATQDSQQSEDLRRTRAQLRELWETPTRTATSRPAQIQQLPGYRGWAPGVSDDDEDTYVPGPRTHSHFTANDLSYLPQSSRRRAEENSAGHSRLPWINVDPQQHTTETVGTDDIERTVAAPALPESSLRTTALLQSVRRNRHLSARSQSRLQRYILDRERTGPDNDENRLQSANSRHGTSTDQRDEIYEALRERAHPRTGLPHTPSFKQALTYLENIRSGEYSPEYFQAMRKAGVLPSEYASSTGDLLTSPSDMHPPPRSSWLQVGCSFSGSQRAEGGPPFYSRRAHSRNTHTPVTLSPLPIPNQPVRSNRNYLGLRSYPTGIELPALTEDRSLPHVDSWPVKVTILGVDEGNMTISGTMEAFDVPDRASPKQQSSITTFFEGEIVDFDNFSLETQIYHSEKEDDPLEVDCKYWRRLGPFAYLSKDEVLAAMLSKKWHRDELANKWILMRWKGLLP